MAAQEKKQRRAGVDPRDPYTRPLTAHELHSIAFALTESIARQRNRYRRDFGTCSTLLDEFRTAAEALYFVTDHINNDHRWTGEEEDEETPAAEAATPATATPLGIAPTTVARLEVLRAEFADDPAGIELVIDLARAVQQTVVEQQATRVVAAAVGQEVSQPS